MSIGSFIDVYCDGRAFSMQLACISLKRCQTPLYKQVDHCYQNWKVGFVSAGCPTYILPSLDSEENITLFKIPIYESLVFVCTGTTALELPLQSIHIIKTIEVFDYLH